MGEGEKENFELVALEQFEQTLKQPDFKGERHREIVTDITRSIFNAKEEETKVKGLRVLGDYANGRGKDYKYHPEVQKEAVSEIAYIAENEDSIHVKVTALDAIFQRLKRPDFGDETQAQALQSIARIASSITVTDHHGQEATVIADTIRKLGEYANSSGENYLYRPEVQKEVPGIMNYINTAVNVTDFSQLE